MGRPLITSDVPGCREAVDANVSGLLCQAKCAVSLAEALHQFLLMPPDARAAMGAAGRRKMAREFDEKFVIDAYLQELLALGITPGSNTSAACKIA